MREHPPRFGRHGLDAALTVAKRLRSDLHADLMDVDTDGDATTLYLWIPREGVSALHHLRRQLWISFVERNVSRRRDMAAALRSRVTQQRAASIEVAKLTGAVRQRLLEAGRLGAAS